MKFSNLSISIFLIIIFSSCFSNKEISSFQQVKKEEQIKILNEIKLIKEGLDSIMNDTDNVHLSLKEKIT